jgi:hypothetical protein
MNPTDIIVQVLINGKYLDRYTLIVFRLTCKRFHDFIKTDTKIKQIVEDAYKNILSKPRLSTKEAERLIIEQNPEQWEEILEDMGEDEDEGEDDEKASDDDEDEDEVDEPVEEGIIRTSPEMYVIQTLDLKDTTEIQKITFQRNKYGTYNCFVFKSRRIDTAINFFAKLAPVVVVIKKTDYDLLFKLQKKSPDVSFFTEKYTKESHKTLLSRYYIKPLIIVFSYHSNFYEKNNFMFSFDKDQDMMINYDNVKVWMNIHLTDEKPEIKYIESFDAMIDKIHESIENFRIKIVTDKKIDLIKKSIKIGKYAKIEEKKRNQLEFLKILTFSDKQTMDKFYTYKPVKDTALFLFINKQELVDTKYKMVYMLK